MTVTVTTGQGGDDPQTEERAYVASYHVGDGPVYRAETAEEAVDPRAVAERALVACGRESKG
jgi:hypothetical protein